MHTIKVLLWKHMVVRKRRFINTAVDLVSPLAFFFIMFFVKGYINPIQKFSISEDFSVQETEPIEITTLPGPTAIFYTPHTDLTGLLMDQVGESLNLHRKKYSSGDYEMGYMPFTNITELLNTNRKLMDTDAIVIFQNMNGTWPEHLNYTIRMKGNFKTEKLNAEDGSLGPHERFGTVYEPFIRLQWAIDSSFIQLLSGNEIQQRVMLQEFPYVREKTVPAVKRICIIMEFVSWVSLTITFIFVMIKLLEERITGIQELIKMVGVSNTAINVSHFLNMLPVCLVYSVGGTLLLTISSNPAIPLTNPLLITICLALHFISVLSMAYACSYSVTTTQYSVTVAAMVYMLLWTPARLLQEYEGSWRLLTGLLPFVPVNWFWTEVGEMEAVGKGASFGSILVMHSDGSGSILAAYLLLVLQTMIFLALGWYLSQINPGPFGQSQPWNFICSKSFWGKPQVEPEDETEEELTEFQDPQYFEEPPKHMHAGIRILDVTKVFGKQRSLSSVSLDVYRGEITVLLGHNGAGKTTLMSIISGMMDATEGKVLVEGYDTVTEKVQMRKMLGLCPQHNLFFPDLTVLEHVTFFTLLKGDSRAEAAESAGELVERLGLSPRASHLSSQLSGGMKRRLQLGCALAGDARVLLLDEPTSGLDVETRRSLWDLLLSLRGERTVLLSTHFMEEADALGDRVAALHAGRLVCHATTMHLKRAIGTGYRLSFTTEGRPREEAITPLIVSQVPQATVKERSLNSISYSLPATSTPKFPKLFNLLEAKKAELGITSIGVGISTLEEVFLKLCSNITTTFTEEEIDGGTTEENYKRDTGMVLYGRQFMALFYRHIQYFYSKKSAFLLMNIVFPILTLGIFMVMSNQGSELPRPPNTLIELDLNLYKPQTNRRVMLNVEPGTDVRMLGDAYPDIDFELTGNVAEAILRAGKKDVFEYNKYLIGIEINETHANALYTTLLRHAAPVSVGVLANALATRALPAADGRTLLARAHPLMGDPLSQAKEPKTSINCMLWAIWEGFVILATVINYTSLPCVERSSGARHALTLAGAPPALQWTTTLVAHGLPCVLLMVLPTVLLTLMDKEATLDSPDYMAMSFVLLSLAVLAFLAFSYLVSFWFEEQGTSVTLVLFVVLFGFITPTIKTVRETFLDNVQSFTDFLLLVASYTMPPHATVRGAMKGANCAYLNALCALNREGSCNVPDNVDGMDKDKCCVQRVNPRCYFCFDDYSPMPEMMILLVQIVAYMALVYLTEIGVFNVLFDRIYNASYNPGPAAEGGSETVKAEKEYVDKTIKLPARDIPDALLVNDVHKRYFSLAKKSPVAVQGVSFSVKKGECFGLLGVNGAGKTSTFKMLAALECASRGSVFANGHFMTRASMPYLTSLGYCPQFMGVDAFLSGRDNLALLLTLRGLSREDVTRETDIWIAIVGLESCSSRVVSGYSGGMARRLTAAAALCSGARVALLDEPTAGVDVAARRRVWAALRRAMPQRAVVITSHSMDEMEALCNRIGIMSAGRLRALGSAAALRAQHGAGHAIRIKLAPAAGRGDVTDCSASDVMCLKGYLHDKFDCTLRDEHKTMLHYHINDTIRYSELFSELERLKKTFPALVEDYEITETTLEEVFLSFAKEQNTSV